jgi:hypothetical protein
VLLGQQHLCKLIASNRTAAESLDHQEHLCQPHPLHRQPPASLPFPPHLRKTARRAGRARNAGSGWPSAEVSLLSPR